MVQVLHALAHNKLDDSNISLYKAVTFNSPVEI